MSENKWTVFNGKTNDFECKRCGETKHMELPMECTQFAHIGFAFASLHDYCRLPGPALPDTSGSGN